MRTRTCTTRRPSTLRRGHDPPPFRPVVLWCCSAPSAGASRTRRKWIDAAVAEVSGLVTAACDVPDPKRNMAEAARLTSKLARTKARVMGEVQIREGAEDRDAIPSSPSFHAILELSAQRGCRA